MTNEISKSRKKTKQAKHAKGKKRKKKEKIWSVIFAPSCCFLSILSTLFSFITR
jgi:hypothetical protein